MFFFFCALSRTANSSVTHRTSSWASKAADGGRLPQMANKAMSPRKYLTLGESSPSFLPLTESKHRKCLQLKCILLNCLDKSLPDSHDVFYFASPAPLPALHQVGSVPAAKESIDAAPYPARPCPGRASAMTLDEAHRWLLVSSPSS